MPDQPVAPSEGQLAFLLAQVGGLAAARFAERLAPLGLTPAQAGLLRVVGKAPGRSQQALATHLGVAPSRLVALVDALERADLLERRRDLQDRRYHAVHLTPEGEQRLRLLGRTAQAHGRELLAPLAQHDRALLAEMLGRLAEAHGLTAEVHPGYRSLGQASAATSGDAPAP